MDAMVLIQNIIFRYDEEMFLELKEATIVIATAKGLFLIVRIFKGLKVA